MGDWKLTTNSEIDSLQLKSYVRRLVLKVISVLPLHTVTRQNNSTYEKLSFVVNNAMVGNEGSEKIIYCIVHEDAVNKFAHLIKPNTIISLQGARVIEKKNVPGNTPFSLQIFENTLITFIYDLDDNIESNEIASMPRSSTSRARDVESGQLSESSRKIKRRTTDFFDELKEGLVKFDVTKRRKLELDILYRVQTALLERNFCYRPSPTCVDRTWN